MAACVTAPRGGAGQVTGQGMSVGDLSQVNVLVVDEDMDLDKIPLVPLARFLPNYSFSV